jgi:cytochrome c biogenesis protein CcdA/thiol-disulfide isomerase/thioredoxin
MSSVVVLILFAVLAGAGTALSPCVLPVLPALLSASGSGGRRRPLGIVLGLTVTFTVTIVGIAKVAGGVGLGSDPLRDLAVVVLIIFGVAVAVPAVGRVVERPLAGLSRLGPRSRGDGFASGLVVGGALGFVYTPCAGPILAAVISVSAATGRTFAVGLAYAVGSAIVLLALALGGRRVVDRLRAAGRGGGLQRALGVVMILTGVVIALQLDVKLDQRIAQDIPNVSLTAGLEKSHAVSSRLDTLRGAPSRFAQTPTPTTPAAAGAAAAQLPSLGAAPAFTGTQRWFNTPGGAPLTLAGLRGRVVLVDFWTYTCINCLRTLPYLEAWDARYRGDGLTIVGVHTPEFSFEHDASNVASAIKSLGIRYPVAQDNNMSTWNAWGNQYWPAEFLIDAKGQVRSAHFGEGDYGTTEADIRALLAQAGRPAAGADARPVGAITPSQQASPETYLGSARAQGWVPTEPTNGTHTSTVDASPLSLSSFRYGGTWTISAEQAVAGPAAQIDAEVQAKNVYLVLSPPSGGGIGHVKVAIDGHPAPSAGDVRNGTVSVTAQRLYTLAAFPTDGRHRLTLTFSPGTRGFSFTFG